MQTISGTENSATEPTFGIQTISGTETIAFVAIGKNTFLRTVQGIGTAIGTATVTTGGTGIGVLSLTDRG
jgi:hypothetical protein